MDNNTNQSDGVGFFGLLTILFIGLKLANIINWSWWWVFAPLWMPLAIFIAVALVIFIVATIVRALNK
jgi:uncharacterized protein (DUF983 family)